MRDEEIRRLLTQAGMLLGIDPADAAGVAEQARSRAVAGQEHWLLSESLAVLARAHQSAGDAARAGGRAMESLGLALALHDVGAEQKALSLLQLLEPAVAAEPLGTARDGDTPRRDVPRNRGSPLPDCRDVLLAYAGVGEEIDEAKYRQVMPAAVERRPLLGRSLEFLESLASTDSLHDGDYLLSIGALCREQGNSERAIEYASRALNEYERAGDRSGLAVCHTNVGEVYLRRGRYERALQVFDMVLASLGTAPDGDTPRRDVPGNRGSPALLPALGFAAETCLHTGDLARARNCCDQGLALARSAGNQVEQAQALLRKAELLLATEELPEAGEALRVALAIIFQTGVPYLEACAQRLIARLLAVENRPEPAGACFAAAVETLTRLDRRPELARTLADSGRYRLELGARAEGIEQLQRAVELFRSMEAVNEALGIERYLVQQDSRQDRRLMILRSLSSLVTQLLPAEEFVRRSLDLLRDALKCAHGTVYLAANQQFLGDSPDDWGPGVSGDEVRAALRYQEYRAAGSESASVQPIECLPLKLSGRPIGAVCLQLQESRNQGIKESRVSASNPGIPGSLNPRLGLDGSFRETLSSLLAMGLANGLEAEIAPSGRESSSHRRHSAPRFPGIVGSGRAMQEVYDLIDRVAPTPASVLIRGESGTGKELLARAISQRSHRAARPFVAVNCAAIPEALLESELFGVERGVATGVAARVGKFELAHSGTMFLDEIGDMSLPLQAKLLRVLQSRSFERVGGRTTIEVDVRIVAATNRDLEKAMAEGKFRQDLYYRLNVMTIVLPPLRDRTEDLPALVSHFLAMYNQEFARQTAGVAPEVMALFRRYPWPGNIRELGNLIERAVILCPTETIRVTDLPVAFQNFARENPEPVPTESRADTPRELWQSRKRAKDQATTELERKLVSSAVERNKGNITKAARELGVSRAQLYRLMDRHRLRDKPEG
jgi:DNA-binding NtrC family response regulator/tetratricopeptide (TPR) repeat protein